MNPSTFANRLQGGIAAYFVEEGLLCAVSMLVFYPKNVNFIGIMTIQALIGIWLFFGKKSPIILGIICKAYFFGFVLRSVLSPQPNPAGLGFGSNNLVYWLLLILEGGQVFILFLLRSLNKKLIAQGSPAPPLPP
jgi:hypothetical protein